MSNTSKSKYKIIKICILLVTIILFVNIPLVTLMIDSVLHQDYYDYSNGDGTFTLWCGSFKEEPYPNGLTLSLTTIDTLQEGETKPVGAQLREIYPNADTVIYRLFYKNPFKFWHWYEYLFTKDHKFDFPYKSWQEIYAKRPKDFKINPQWQQF